MKKNQLKTFNHLGSLCLLIIGTQNSFAHAGVVKVIAEYHQANTPLVDPYAPIIDEIRFYGTDISSTTQQQCQQQQYNGEPDYFEVCKTKLVIYRQKLTFNDGVLEFKSKVDKNIFRIDSRVSQQAMQQQQQLLQSQLQGPDLITQTPQLYYQCKSFLVQRYLELNWNKVLRNHTTFEINENKYNSCIENGGDVETCKAISKIPKQIQQQQQQSHSQYSDWRMEGGICQIILAD